MKKHDISFICQFSLDDFKTKYAGSLFGFLWAFLQPMITVIIYWFIFQVGFKNGAIDGMPYILWLISGLIPWFFISDAISNATPCLVEYSYLVKKILFNIDILPVVRIVSVLFIHFSLLIFAFIIFALYGCMPPVQCIQLVYYMLYMLVLSVGIAYLTSSLHVFFRDISQIVSIILQIIFWVTPIVWQMDIMSGKIQRILRYNPLFYIINGYRDSFIHGKWFFTYRLQDTLYYWFVALVILALGVSSFRKLKPHFADVL